VGFEADDSVFGDLFGLIVVFAGFFFGSGMKWM